MELTGKTPEYIARIQLRYEELRNSERKLADYFLQRNLEEPLTDSVKQLAERTQLPAVVKPIASGSSIGVYIAKTRQELERALEETRPAAVYVTSPDYLGGTCDVAALAEVSHRRGVPLLVDNAHGAYLRFLSPSRHPMDLGADLCCDSAHKTLPVLTGGAYLHVGRGAPAFFGENGRRALALFGSTSPSYLILQSLDLCNRYLSEDFPARLAASAARLEELREQLRRDGWAVWETDPLKVTVDCAASGWDGRTLARRLRGRGIECEYCDQDDLVLMWTPENGAADRQRLLDALGRNTAPPRQRVPFAAVRGEAVCSVREAMFLPHETMSVSQAVGRICGAPAVGCPPAVPIVSAGETVSPAAAELFRRYGVETVEVLRDGFPARRG